jgi:hypothetical protein
VHLIGADGHARRAGERRAAVAAVLGASAVRLPAGDAAEVGSDELVILDGDRSVSGGKYRAVASWGAPQLGQ